MVGQRSTVGRLRRQERDGTVPQARNWNTMLRVLISRLKDGLLPTDM
jgi:hypothetical protein